MNHEQQLKMTELDCLTAAPHLQMIKAALPYIHVPEQRFFSLMVKISELERTLRLFDKGEDGEVGICALEADAPSSPVDMLNAMKPFGNEEQQDFIDLILNFMEGANLYQSYRESMEQAEQQTEGFREARDSKEQQDIGEGDFAPHRTEPRRFPLEHLKSILPPEQQSRLETAQLLMQAFQQA